MGTRKLKWSKLALQAKGLERENCLQLLKSQRKLSFRPFFFSAAFQSPHLILNS